MSKETRRAAIWTIASTGVAAIAQLIQISVAARYLDAHAFGALAIVNVMMAIVTGFQDMGLSSYCIHLGQVPQRSHSTLFWISTVLGGLGAIATFAIATPLADFYHIPSLTSLLQLLSINFLLIGLSGQYQANYIRVFKAQLLAQIELAARLIGLGAAIYLLVVAGAGPEAVVIGMEVFAVLRLALMVILADAQWHPHFQFDRPLARRALSYGSFQAGSQIVNQLRTQADQLIIGKALGAEMLGIYSISKELIGYPMRVIQPLIARLTLPTYARYQGDPVKLREVFIGGLRKVALICAIIYGALAVLAPWVVELLYGPKFAVVSALIPMMIMFGVLRPMGLNTGMLAQATGRTANEFRWNVGISFVTLVPNLLVGYFAPTLATFAVTLSVIQVAVSLLAYPFFIKPLDAIGMKVYVRSWFGPALAALAAALFSLTGWISLPPITILIKSLLARLGLHY